MNYYIEINIIPNIDIGINFIIEKLFRQLHLGLVRMKNTEGRVPIGVSFPEYDLDMPGLGSKMRLFALNKEDLEILDIQKCFESLTDYVHLTGIRMVPGKVTSYGCYSRQQPKSSNIRLARRKAKRHGIEFEQALQILDNHKEKRVKTPFINMSSQSTKHRFKLFVLKSESDELIDEGFNCYGLSSKSTVPEF